MIQTRTKQPKTNDPEVKRAVKAITAVLDKFPRERAVAVLGAVALLRGEYDVARRCMSELATPSPAARASLVREAPAQLAERAAAAKGKGATPAKPRQARRKPYVETLRAGKFR